MHFLLSTTIFPFPVEPRLIEHPNVTVLYAVIHEPSSWLMFVIAFSYLTRRCAVDYLLFRRCRASPDNLRPVPAFPGCEMSHVLCVHRCTLGMSCVISWMRPMQSCTLVDGR